MDDWQALVCVHLKQDSESNSAWASLRDRRKVWHTTALNICYFQYKYLLQKMTFISPITQNQIQNPTLLQQVKEWEKNFGTYLPRKICYFWYTYLLQKDYNHFTDNMKPFTVQILQHKKLWLHGALWQEWQLTILMLYRKTRVFRRRLKAFGKCTDGGAWSKGRQNLESVRLTV